MAQLIDINKSSYINTNIEIYAENKIGQYSKFLDKTPIYVTYYSINQTQTRSDVGTGAVEAEIGESSPIRFNKILEFPLYNFPELKPDITFDESGYDVDLDLSGIIVLPNTIKPIVSDYFVFQIPGVNKQLLFRVNNITYNTIQSNDFYQIDVDIKDIKSDIISTLASQVVETYQTIFENIGTQDKCFIILEDLEKVKGILKLFYNLLDMYKNIFYNKECNSFVLYNNTSYPDYWLYDYYISKFISDTNVYYKPNSENALLLTYNDTVPLDVDNIFNRTLLGAVFNRSLDFLNTYTYYYQSTINKPYSPFIINNYPCNSTTIYFSTTKLTTENSTSFADGSIVEYYSIQLMEDLKNGTLTSTDYLDMIIFNYLTGNTVDISKDSLLAYGFTDDIKTYMYLPIVLYIIRQYYDEYFKKS